MKPAKDGRKNNGGSRAGAGRPKTGEKRKRYSLALIQADVERAVGKKKGALRKFVEKALKEWIQTKAAYLTEIEKIKSSKRLGNISYSELMELHRTGKLEPGKAYIIDEALGPPVKIKRK